jgi:hypothetical protein
VVVENGEIVLVQIADEFAVAIGRDEEHVDFIDAAPDGEDRLVRFVAGGEKGSGTAGIHRNGRSGDDVGTGLGASGNGQTKNGGDREYDYGESARCQPELVALCHSSLFFDCFLFDSLFFTHGS